VRRIVQNALRRSYLHHITQVHHRKTVGNVFHNPNIMRDNQVANPILVLNVVHQIKNITDGRHIQTRSWFISYQELWVKGQRTGDAHSPRLAS